MQRIRNFLSDITLMIRGQKEYGINFINSDTYIIIAKERSLASLFEDTFQIIVRIRLVVYHLSFMLII